MGLLDIMVSTLQSIENKGSSYLTYVIPKGYMCGYMRAYKAVIVPPIAVTIKQCIIVWTSIVTT